MYAASLDDCGPLEWDITLDGGLEIEGFTVHAFITDRESVGSTYSVTLLARYSMSPWSEPIVWLFTVTESTVIGGVCVF